MLSSSKIRFMASFLIILAIWWVSSGTFFVEQIVPKPDDVAAVFVKLTANGELFADIFASFKRICIGYAIGVSLGFSIGLLTGMYILARTIAYPFIEFFRCIPPVALIPLVVSIFGIGEAGKYFIIAYAATFVMIYNTASGVVSTPVIRVRAAQCLGANGLAILRWVVIPSAWPYVLTGLRLALGFSFMGVVAAEMLAAQKGIGFLIMQSTNILDAKEMFVGFVLLGTFGFLTDQLFKLAVSRRLRRYMLEIETI
jgi:ABC-type nitrate/sulfonate/bicarbonate transport system permease component